MAVLTPQQQQIVREWATANGLNPLVQVNHAEELLQSGAYPSFAALAEQAQFNRTQELKSQAQQPVAQPQAEFRGQPIEREFRATY